MTSGRNSEKAESKCTQLSTANPMTAALYMGIKKADGSVCYILGLRKDIRAKIKKQPGDHVRVTVFERE